MTQCNSLDADTGVQGAIPARQEGSGQPASGTPSERLQRRCGGSDIHLTGR